MNRIINILTGFLTVLLLIGGLTFVDEASAQTLISEVSAPQQNVDSAFERFVNQTQLSFEKAFQDTQQLVSDLPQLLERVTTEPQVAVRKQIEDDLENRQDRLENLADSVDDLAEKVQSYNKKLTSPTQAATNTELQKNALNIQQSLDNVAQTIDRLADDVEKAKDNSTAVFRTQIGGQIEAVSQALEGANSALKAFNQNPA